MRKSECIMWWRGDNIELLQLIVQELGARMLHVSDYHRLRRTLPHAACEGPALHMTRWSLFYFDVVCNLFYLFLKVKGCIWYHHIACIHFKLWKQQLFSVCNGQTAEKTLPPTASVVSELLWCVYAYLHNCWD